MKVVFLALLIIFIASIFLARSYEGFEIELQYELPSCDGHGHDTPMNSSVVVVRGYYYSDSPRLFSLDGTEIVPYQFDSDEVNLTYYYTVPTATINDDFVVSTPEDIKPQITINTGDNFHDTITKKIQSAGCVPLPGSKMGLGHYYSGDCRTGPFEGPYSWRVSLGE